MGLSNKSTISVVMDLDNAAFSISGMWVERVNKQLAWIYLSSESHVIEIIITHAQNQSNTVQRYVENLPKEWANRVTSLGVENERATYYEMKNRGAEQAKGDILVFMDCDLTPVRGSFSDLVTPLFDTDVVASCGFPFFPANSFISKVYSLFWFFPIDQKAETIGKHQLIVNTVAFKKSVFLKTSFETQVGGFKVCCHLLALRIKAEGGVIAHPDVWFEHELWNKAVGFFVWRSVVGGRDMDKKFALVHSKKKSARLKAAFISFSKDIKRVYVRNRQYHTAVNLGFVQTILSTLLGWLFFSFLRMSQVVSALSQLKNNIEHVPDKFVS